MRASDDSRRDAVLEVQNWEELRQYATDVKAHTLRNLAEYLEKLEEKVIQKGGRVLWAETGEQAIQMVLDLAHERKIQEVVKSKSMLTEELHLNESLVRARVQPIETDLGEYVVQIAGERPSHLIAPALHKSKEEIAQLFVEQLGMRVDGDVQEITATARRVLRQNFLRARMGITGVNFAVAETGTIVVVENEGNARLSLSVPEIHVALMGIEKVIPRLQDLPVFLKLLTRSATGQKATSYVNCINGPRNEAELDGPGEFYLILVDNGRSRILEDPLSRQTLACIRCGACQNVCPVYQRIGGHAYRSVYQGPIGAILTPQLESFDTAPEHAFASSLCGDCREVCPVKIDIPQVLLHLREKMQTRKSGSSLHFPIEKMLMLLWARVMESPQWYENLTRVFRTWMRMGKWKSLLFLVPFLKRWSLTREFPEWPERSFREMFPNREEGS